MQPWRHRAETSSLDGFVAPGFEPVRDVFAENFRRRGEWGASVCAWHEDRVVVDLWGGVADQRTQRAWQRDTIGTVFSSTKGMVALCFLMLADRGLVDYDLPVTTYWREFGAAGKQDVTVRTLLNHRAGLISVTDRLTIDQLESDEAGVARSLARQTPAWTPDTDQGYHAVTYGLYTQELFRRITGETIGAFLAREIAGPLDADVHIGLAEEHEPRVAVNYPATTSERVLKIIPKLLFHRGNEGRVYRQVAFGGDAARAFSNPRELGPSGIHNFNTRRVRAMELPWGNGVANARGLCRVYSALANGGSLDGVRLVAPATLDPLARRQSWSERDRVLRKPVGWSQGFLKEETTMFSPNTESFGHPGAGGALGWCDPTSRLAVAYTTNKMDHRIRSPRALALCRALYYCLR